MRGRREARQRIRFLCAVGVSAEQVQLAALAIDASWSAGVAGACRASVAGAFKARVGTIALRSAVVGRVYDACRRALCSPVLRVALKTSRTPHAVPHAM